MPTNPPERFAAERVFADYKKLPPRLYHYTSQEGLLGILFSKTLWATRIQYLNDSTEFAYALGLLKNAFTLDDHQRSLTNRISLQPALDASRKALDALKLVPIQVACFSEKQDDLSQWRGYCAGGSGFSIGFDPNQLVEAADRRAAFIAPCIYDCDRQSQLVKQLVGGFIKDGLAEVRARRISSPGSCSAPSAAGA
jgi:DUF2971 family protein